MTFLVIVAIVWVLRNMRRSEIASAGTRALIIAMAIAVTAFRRRRRRRSCSFPHHICDLGDCGCDRGVCRERRGRELGGDALVNFVWGFWCSSASVRPLDSNHHLCRQCDFAELNFLRRSRLKIPEPETIVVEFAPLIDRIFDFPLSLDFRAFAFNNPLPADTQFGIVKAVLNELGLPSADRKIIPLGTYPTYPI